MINILIVDDEKHQVDLIEYLICKLGIIENIRIFKAYSSKEFMEVIVTERIDIAFVDIRLHEDLNGIDIAAKLKSKNKNSIIIFVTAYKEYGYDSYSVHAFDYFLKPIMESSFKSLLVNIKEEYNRNIYLEKKCKYLLVKEGERVSKVPYDDIYYFEKIQRKVLIHSRFKKYEVSTSLKKILSENMIDSFFLDAIRVIL